MDDFLPSVYTWNRREKKEISTRDDVLTWFVVIEWLISGYCVMEFREREDKKKKQYRDDWFERFE